MELIIKPYSALCILQEFKINGIEAEVYDFGSSSDEDSENAEDYCCGNMKFRPCLPTDSVLEKYKITTDEYITICDKIDIAISFGSCGWCS